MKKFLAFLLGIIILLLYSSLLWTMFQDTVSNKASGPVPFLVGLLGFTLVYGFHKWFDSKGF